VALGSADGTFQAARPLGISAGYYPALADLNGDSHLDIVAGNSSDGAATVYLGKGDGTFAFHVALAASIALQGTGIGGNHGAGAILVGDINNDRKPDVLVAVPESAPRAVGSLFAFINQGDGAFNEPIVSANVAAWRGAAADFNGDGYLDYAGDLLNSGALEVWLGTGDGTFARKSVYSLSDIKPLTVDVMDLNSDSIPDLAVSGQELNTGYEVPLSIFLGKGDGTFRSRVTYIGANGAIPMNVPPRVADFNRDGLPDLLTHGWNGENSGITIGLAHGDARTSGAGFQLNVEADSSTALVLEYSSNLINWTPLATNAAPHGLWPLVDTAITLPTRFYRTHHR